MSYTATKYFSTKQRFRILTCGEVLVVVLHCPARMHVYAAQSRVALLEDTVQNLCLNYWKLRERKRENHRGEHKQ